MRSQKKWIALSLLLLVGTIVGVRWLGPPSIESSSWLLVDLGVERGDRSAAAGVLGGAEELRPGWLELRRVLRRAARDERIAGVCFELGQGDLSPALAEPCMALIGELRAAGKSTVVRADSLELASWWVAQCADEVVLHPAGRLDLRPRALWAPYVGGALRERGIAVEVVRLGAESVPFDQLTQTAADADDQQRWNSLQQAFWQQLQKIAALDGEHPSAEWSLLAGSMSAARAHENRWVDRLLDRREWVSTQAATENPVIPVSLYAQVSDGAVGLKDAPRIAVLSLEGMILERELDASEFGATVTAAIGPVQTVAELELAVDEILATPEISGVLLKVESVGGDAFASEEARRVLARLRERLPVVALLGSRATGGGFYAALVCDRIYASSTTITGAIGAAGGRWLLDGLWQQAGVDVYAAGEPGQVATSPWSPLTELERANALREVQESYNRFLDRLQQGRSLDRVAALVHADGALLLGSEAAARGLVDGVGGWRQAWQQICSIAEVGDAASASFEVFPRPAGWWQRVRDREEKSSQTSGALLAEAQRWRSWYLGPWFFWNPPAGRLPQEH